MIKALIFDCFGVLVTEAWVPFRDTTFGHNPQLLQQATDAATALNLGYVSEVEFRAVLSQLSTRPMREINTALDKSVLDERVLNSIRYCKPKYKVGMLSNISPNRLQDFFSAAQMSLFDDLALSFEIGAVKPDPNAYRIAAERLDVRPDECLFIDDIERNLIPARALGMETIHYKNFAQFEQDLKELLQ